MRRLMLIGLAGAALAGAIISLKVAQVEHDLPKSTETYTSNYDGRLITDGFDFKVVTGDGQAYVALARDPTLARPEEFGSTAEAAYRAERPLLGYVVWAVSFGQSDWAPRALALVCALGSGLAAAAAAHLLRARLVSPWLGLAVVVLPGAAFALDGLTCEPLALALLSWGVVAWFAPTQRTAWALTLLSLAALTRETALVVPLALAMTELRHRRVRSAALLTVPVAALVVWDCFVRLRIGSWPWAANQDRLGLPLSGLVSAARDWANPGPEVISLGLLIALATWVVTRCRRDPLTVIVLGHVALALVMGSAVWTSYTYSQRILLPGVAFGLVCVAGAAAIDEDVRAVAPVRQ